MAIFCKGDRIPSTILILIPIATTTIGAANYVTDCQYDVVENLYKTLFGASWAKAVYDENGNIAGVLNSNSSKSFYSYDDGGRLKNL